jgi:zinc protease
MREWLSTVRREFLPNGVRVLVHEMRTAPVVALGCWVGSGSDDGPHELPGLAHFLEHMIFRGARAGSGSLGRETPSRGELRAETTQSHTRFCQIAPGDGWRGALPTHAARFGVRALRSREIEAERRVIIEEARSEESDPWGFLWRRLVEAVFAPYCHFRPAVGTLAGITRIGAGDLRAFHDQHYVAGNVVLVVVGDVDPNEVMDLAASLSDVPPGVPLRRVHPAPERHGLVRRRHLGAVSQAYAAVGFRVPHLLHPDAPSLHVVACLLGAGRSSRLMATLNADRDLVARASAEVVCGRDEGLLVVRAASSPEATDEVVARILEEVRALARRPPSAPEMQRVARRLETAHLVERETADSVGCVIGLFETLGGFEQARTHVDRVSTVSADDVMRCAERYLEPDHATAVTYAPRQPRRGGP